MKHEPVFLRRATTPTPEVDTTTSSGIPPDLLREAAVRLGRAGLLYSGVYFLAFFGSWLLNPGHIEWMDPSQFPGHVVAIVSIASGVGIYLLSRFGHLRPESLLDIGLFFMVAGALGISFSNVWAIYPDSGSYGAWMEALSARNAMMGIPWECVWIIVFVLVAPNTPGKTLLASLAAASAGPLIIVVSKSTGATAADVPLSDFIAYYLTTTYLCAGIAYVMSRIIFNYGRRLSRAREVGAYRLSRMLGQGGMGEVWRGDHRMLARPAAIKLIRAEALGGQLGAGSAVLKRFEREARATAALRSKHTVDLYDFGVADDGSFYYVMELLDGMSLREMVDRFGPMAPGRVVHLLRQVCHSLGEAHERGLVHRDVKPANIFVCRLGPDRDFVKVLDFGLVKDVGDYEGGHQITEAGVVTGTPAFMAPELASGSAIDGRSDIYALGCVAYFLLTGRPVFDADTPVAMLLAHVQLAPRPIGERTELDVPPELERVILWCLEKDPADRPQTTAELDRGLADCVGLEPWTDEAARQWWALHGTASVDSP